MVSSNGPACRHGPVILPNSGVPGPSGAGKGVLVQNMILDIYKGCFERVYVFSPSINVDVTWQPVK